MEHSGKQLSVVWRGRNFLLVMDECAKLKDLGETLQKLTNVQIDTLRLIIPEKKGSKLLYPFSDEHSNLPLEAVSTVEGKSIRMMGVPENEVEQVLQSVKTDLRIAGFDEEERRLRQRVTYNHKSIIQLPQGIYVFSAFRTLSLPGIELSPPASEALKIMHRLAADPGIVAVMNKHRWRVGIMTELAPVGYVGVNPKCILGFNKNQGEEISLRLRTDDLKGFRKYESIKMTLLHELTHMVFSDHDANFLALNSQLNKEATALDWTKSKGHTLNGIGPAMHYEEEYGIDSDVSLSYKLGGQELGFSTARASSVAAAYRRFAETSPNVVRATDASEDLDQMVQENDSLEESKTEGHGFDTSPLASNDPLRMEIDGNPIQHRVSCKEPDPDDSQAVDDNAMFEETLPYQEGTKPHEPMNLPYREPDPDDSQVNVVVEKEPEPKYNRMVIDEMSIDQSNEPDPDDSQVSAVVVKELESGNRTVMDGVSNGQSHEPDPDDSQVIAGAGKALASDNRMAMGGVTNGQSHEPDPDDSQVSAGAEKALESDNRMVMGGVTNGQSHEPDPDDSQASAGAEKALESDIRMVMGGVTNGQSHEPDPDDSQASIVVGNEHSCGNDHSRVTISEGASLIQSVEPDPDDLELQRIQDPAKAIYSQLQKAMDMLRSEVDPLDVTVVLQTLLKIIRNAIEHPTELKFRKIRKSNLIIQRNILRYEAAKDMLQLVGFCEDVIINEVGKSDAYLVLKRNDPGLLWLVRSSLESYNA